MKQKNRFRIVKKFGPHLIRALIGSQKIKFINKNKFEKIEKKYGTVIYAFWHNRMLPLTYTHRDQDVHIIISEHKDGEYISLVTDGLGFQSIRGSSTRGGVKALKKAVAVSKNYNLAVTPDGPQGPKYTVNKGILYLSYRCQKPIIPVSWDSDRKWILNTWDDFIIPKPFANTRLIYGDAIFIKKKEDINRMRAYLKTKLIALEKRVEF